MKSHDLILIVTLLAILAACNISKKNTKTETTPSTSKAPSSSSENFVFVKPATGIYPPEEKDLAAIQQQFNDVTLSKLKQGHFLYSKGSCINCHSAFSIYERSESKWKTIIDEMAKRAFLSSEQKDAVYKYVLAMKAGQSK